MKTFNKIYEFFVKVGEARARYLQKNPSLMRWY